MKRYLIRAGIILAWLCFIFAALYWPKWKILKYDSNSINVFAWGDILEPSAIEEFEKETGIKIHLNYYSSNEELMVKLKATKGEGYDLVIPSDYAVDLLSKEGLLKKIDKSKLDFWKELNPRLLGHEFDPNNDYSIPFEWEIFGMGIDKTYFKGRPFDPSWRLIFDPSIITYKIGMTDDFIEAILMASYYLFGPQETLNEDQIQQVKNLLIQQKAWVEAYANFRADYFLATKNCPVVVASSSYIWRTMRTFDFVGFVVPREGTFITIENLSIPKPSAKEDLIYKFINFLYQPKIIAKHYETYGFFPSTLHALDLLNLDPQAKSLILSSQEDFNKFHFFTTLFSEQQMRDIWVEVKSAGN